MMSDSERYEQQRKIGIVIIVLGVLAFPLAVMSSNARQAAAGKEVEGKVASQAGTATARAQTFRDVPLYPRAVYDQKQTEAMQQNEAKFRTSGEKSTAQSACYTVPASASTVAAWYDQQMATLGWSSEKSKMPSELGGMGLDLQMRMYTCSSATLMVMLTGSSNETQMTMTFTAGAPKTGTGSSAF